MEKKHDAAGWRIDCREMPAPYPLLGARAAIAMMTEGEVLGVLVTDRDSIADLPAWCRMTGNRLLATEERSGVHYLLIRKGTQPWQSH
jgi:tRNA 2-thiouridine synthesizing protein A